MLSCDAIRDAVEEYGDMLYRTCVLMLGNVHDAEDAVQETYITYMRKAPPFSDSEHEKAWLLTVAANKCRDMLRYRKRHITEPESVLDTLVQDSESSYILEALMMLPDKFRFLSVPKGFHPVSPHCGMIPLLAGNIVQQCGTDQGVAIQC